MKIRPWIGLGKTRTQERNDQVQRFCGEKDFHMCEKEKEGQCCWSAEVRGRGWETKLQVTETGFFNSEGKANPEKCSEVRHHFDLVACFKDQFEKISTDFITSLHWEWF